MYNSDLRLKKTKIYKKMQTISLKDYNDISTLLYFYQSNTLGKISKKLGIKQCDLIKNIKLINKNNVDNYLFKQYQATPKINSISEETNNNFKRMKEKIKKENNNDK